MSESLFKPESLHYYITYFAFLQSCGFISLHHMTNLCLQQLYHKISLDFPHFSRFPFVPHFPFFPSFSLGLSLFPSYSLLFTHIIISLVSSFSHFSPFFPFTTFSPFLFYSPFSHRLIFFSVFFGLIFSPFQILLIGQNIYP